MATKLKARKPEAHKTGHVKMVVFGKAGSGKTWLSLQLPTPFYIDVEGGAVRSQYQDRLLQANGAYLARADGAATVAGVIEQVKALATETHAYQTLVIDSLTKLWNSEISKEQERMQASGTVDAFGASKKPAVRQIRRLLDWISKLNMNVVLVCHEMAEWANVDGQRQEIGKIPDCYEKVAYELDLTLRILTVSQGNRIAQVAKSRVLPFPEGSRFNLQVNGQDVSYTQFAERYGKEAIEQPVKPIVLATAEQVAEIERLLSIVKVSD
jgi:nicotinamide riboside kinase